MTDSTLPVPYRARQGTGSLAILLPVLATMGSVAVCVALIGLTGASIPDAVRAFVSGTIGSSYAIGASLNRAVTLALIGLGFVLAFRANLINIGGEGQICVGGIAATATALYGPDGLPAILAITLPLTAGFLAGALWGFIPGWLLVRRGTNEVISTLLMSFIAVYLVYWSVESEALLRRPRTSSSTQPESLPLPDSTELPLLMSASPLHIGIFFAVAAAIIVGVALSRTTFGLKLKAIGLGRMAARRAGIDDRRLILLSMALAGALAGLAGAILIQGEQHILRQGFSSNFGFSGVVVGLLSRGSATGVIIFAVLLGFLRSGGIEMEISAGVPSALVLVCQGLIVIAIAGAGYFMSRRGGAAA